jgi:hypothetical protein
MPKQMSFDAFGINFPESYWELAQINLSLVEKIGSITFFGYSSIKAKNNGDRIIGSKTYRITPPVYNDFFQNMEGNEQFLKNCYTLADTIKDTPISKDGTLYSFFNNAIEV